MGNVWRPDDSDHHLPPLGWQESGLRKSQNLLMLLLELSCEFRKSKKLMQSDSSRDVGQLSQNIKAEES